MFFTFDVICAIVVFLIALVVVTRATMTITVSWSIVEDGEGSGIGASHSTTVTGNDTISTNCAVPASTTNGLFDVYIDCSTLKGIVVTSNTDVTVYTNAASTGSPDDTITIKANIPFLWIYNSGIERPVDGASNIVTKVYITNASVSTAAVVKFKGVQTV